MYNPHQNARTCSYGREQIVQRYQNGEGRSLALSNPGLRCTWPDDAVMEAFYQLETGQRPVSLSFRP